MTKNNRHNLLVILGKRLNNEGKMPAELVSVLDNAIYYYKSHPDSHFLVCGKYAINYDWQGIVPNHYESIEMKRYLIKKGIPSYKIAKERNSKDTIGNIYYAKQYVKSHPGVSVIIVFCTKLHRQRVEYIFNKFFESSYRIIFKTVDSKPSQQDINNEEKEFRYIKGEQSILNNIIGGNDADFKYKLYRNKFYQR